MTLPRVHIIGVEIELWSETKGSNSNLAHAFLHIDLGEEIGGNYSSHGFSS